VLPRTSSSLAAAALLLAAGAAARAQLPRVAERVEVSRVVVGVHVLAGGGQPLRGLGPDDLRVRVDGRPVKIESVRWTSESVALREAPGVAAEPAAPASGAVALPRGRQVVLLFQRDLEPSRMEGLMAMRQRAWALLDSLAPEDRAAIASFDSHLELWTDLTADRAVLRPHIERSIFFAGRPDDTGAPAPAAAAMPALLPAFDRAAGRRAATMEAALVVIGRALDSVPGSKALVIFGHGFGRIVTPAGTGHLGVGFDAEYGEARRLLTRARTVVYCLDLTRADSHTLEAGLMKVAEDTGGFYARTHEFPGRAIARLGEALSGHYELTFEKPDLPWGEHAIRVELVGRRGVVLARRSYVG
jgi:VWFA-related protein